MQVQTSETHFERNAEIVILENTYKKLDQRFGYPASDREICEALKISLDEFNQILAHIKGLDLGNLQRIASQNGDISDETLIRYTPDTSRANSPLVFRETEIREMLTHAIDGLPEIERLIISLHCFDELTLNEIETVLGIKEACISQLYTKAMLRLRSKLLE
jgi:RNA polymerase sigma factor FliA